MGAGVGTDRVVVTDTQDPRRSRLAPWEIAGSLVAMASNRRQNGATAEDALLDPTNLRLLAELQADARLSLAELGRRVGLSSPAVAERVGAARARRGHPRLPRRRRPARARLRAERGHPHPPGAAPDPRGRAARARDARGRRVQPHHRRRLLRDARARARRRSPRGGDRPLHAVRPDDDVDRAVVARARRAASHLGEETTRRDASRLSARSSAAPA